MSYYINMRKLFVLFFVMCLAQKCFAFDIVYPKKQDVVKNSPTTFFIGASDEPIMVNGKNIELHRTGAFAYFVELDKGKNIFEFKTSTETKIYTVTRPNIKPKQLIKAKFISQTPKMYRVKNDKTPLRTSPSNSGLNRVTHLQKGVNLEVDGRLGSFYRVVLTNDKKVWVHKDNVEPVNANISLATISGYDFLETDDYFAYIFHLDSQVPFEVKTGEIYQLKLYNIKNVADDTYVFEFPYREATDCSKTLGYRAEYDGNDLIWKIRKFPKVSKRQPLKNIVITVDAGHGGNEIGAIGCLGDKEKDVVLSIAEFLKDELESRGAKVIMTRTDDITVSLDERVDIANVNDSMVFLSIHGNALPDTMNPNEHRGVSVYYYNDDAKLLGANILYSMFDKLDLPNDKLRQQSFAVIRNPQALSLLLEVGYLINPYDNELLINYKFQKQCAKAIADGVEEYFKGE